MNPHSYAKYTRTPLSIALACIVDVVLDWLRRRPPQRYWVTDAGIEALTSRYTEISLDDWARAPVCELCMQFSAFGLPHAECVAAEAWQAHLRAHLAKAGIA